MRYDSGFAARTISVQMRMRERSFFFSLECRPALAGHYVRQVEWTPRCRAHNGKGKSNWARRPLWSFITPRAREILLSNYATARQVIGKLGSVPPQREMRRGKSFEQRDRRESAKQLLLSVQLHCKLSVNEQNICYKSCIVLKCGNWHANFRI